MESIKKYCQLCQMPGSKGHEKNSEEMIERTTSCRLALGGGGFLKIREIITEVDQVARQNNMCCLCDEPNTKSTISTEDKLKQTVKNKTSKQQKANNRTHKGRYEDVVDRGESDAWQRFINFMNNWNILINAVVDTDGKCQRQFKKLIKPKWFHDLSPKQKMLLKELATSLLDDADEGCLRRSRRFLKEAGINPHPNPSHVQQAKRFANANAVLFLSHLLEEETSNRTDEDDEQTYEYSWNQRLLMSAIAYFELPLLLQSLWYCLPEIPENARTLSEPRQFHQEYYDKRQNLYSTNPYLEPVWKRMPWDWVSERAVEAERRLQEAHDRRKMLCPSDVARTINNLSHIHPRIPESTVGSKDVESPDALPNYEDACVVVKMAHEWYSEFARCPDTPPPSREDGSSESKYGVAGMLDQVVVSLKDKAEEVVKYEDVPTAIAGTMEAMIARGMVCATFPDIEHHPAILQFVKHIKGEEMSRLLKASILIKAESGARCVSELYKETNIPKPSKPPPDSTWGSIFTLRKKAEKERQIFLQNVWKKRCQNTQNVCHSFSPGFIHKRSFLPTFYAYMPSGNETVNYWPNLIKE